MLRSQRLFVDGEGALEEWLDFGVLALVVVKGRQIVEAGGESGAWRPNVFGFFEGG